MAQLPVEVVEMIFKYLISLEDRKSASLVCQQWYLAFLNPYFRKTEVVVFSTERQLRMFPRNENSERHFVHFVMKNLDIRVESMPFWERYGRNIKTLSFLSCNISEQIFVRAMSYCNKIESLSVHDCKELLMSGFQLERLEDQRTLRNAWMHLRTLSLSYNRYLSDAILVKVLALCPHVNSLILTGCQISYHSGMFHKFYPGGMQNPSESVTTFQMILRYLTTNAKRIKTLSLSDTLIDSTSLYNLSLTQKLDLHQLQLRACMQISNQGLIQMCTTTNLKSLTELDVGLCPRITDTSLIILCGSLRQLKKFSLQGCRAITDMGLANIWQLDKLESLNLAECESIHGVGILKGLCYKTNYNIQEIRLSHMGNLTDTIVTGMVEGMPNLRHLDLAHCYNAVTDVSLQAVFRHSTWLRSLNLAMCDRLSDCGLTGMGVSDKPIVPSVAQLLRMPLGSKHEIEILRDAKIKEEVRDMCESELLDSTRTGVSLSNLRGLQSLDLTGCSRVSDVSLKYAFRLTELRKLDLSYCQQVTREGLGHLAHHCTAIEDLNLDMCQNVDDKAVEVVVRDLTRLKKLVLGSSKITNNMACAVLQYGLRLAYFDVIHCGKLTGQGVSHLSQCLPFLQTFHYPEIPAEIESPPPPPPIGLWLRRS